MATKTKTRRWIPCQSYDLEAMESWLEEMARCGWRLEQVGCFGCTAAFAAAAPQMVRYRLTSAMDADTFGTEAWLGPSEESRCLYAAYGWEYVAKRGPFYIYRTRTRPLGRWTRTPIPRHWSSAPSTGGRGRACSPWFCSFSWSIP